ncbi:dsDNA nuclease domain-containing protein [Caproiciproducens galactitolivorans]|uniref:DsDNA nuclease domain-containing protein n=1 Tax=Caproiciproducens galactitolivorans TaxID=642589 RepID=A0ABT4BT01_9FIRM|nr:dsDNA nuclease domain-containing protein [Caproiciproducens galactitolivorans]MCY1714017.1 dsDNA nuclease domain-containing protein [Caproiciproducens galactitolivorans]
MDKKSGSLAYNRLDMQVSQVFHLAIELYDTSDYLMVLDHEDDITIYDDQLLHDSVSFYQMKTKDDSISLTTAITEGWLEKLYSHMDTPDVFVKELGLITNCPLKLDRQLLSADRTPFGDFGQTHIQAIKTDIARRRGIALDDVDLSKMVHMRTTLSIDAHQRIVSDEASDFLVRRFPQIKVQVVKTIVAAVFDVLGRRQAYERLPENASYEEVANKKGFSRTMFDRIIRASMKVNIPEFYWLVDHCKIPSEKKDQAALAYTSVLADSNGNTDSFIDVFDSLESVVSSISISDGETLWDFACRCKRGLLRQKKRMIVVYRNGYYIEILAMCIYLAKEENR